MDKNALRQESLEKAYLRRTLLKLLNVYHLIRTASIRVEFTQRFAKKSLDSSLNWRLRW